MEKAAVQPIQLTAERKAEIEKQADAVLKGHSIHGPSIDIVSLAKEYGFVIQTMPMNGNTAGIMLIDDNNPILETGSHKLIIINEDQDAKESRFITAHELGHYFLHKNNNIQYAHMDRNPQEERDTDEIEADYFASCMLMPREQLNILSRLGHGDNKNLAKFMSDAFRVPNSRFRERFEEIINDSQTA